MVKPHQVQIRVPGFPKFPRRMCSPNLAPLLASDFHKTGTELFEEIVRILCRRLDRHF